MIHEFFGFFLNKKEQGMKKLKESAEGPSQTNDLSSEGKLGEQNHLMWFA